MYRTLQIEGFRRFRQLELDGLKRVNLLVGRNNSGKTSVLEAVSILVNPASVIDLARRRGEVFAPSYEQGMDSGRDFAANLYDELDVSCLFWGYATGNGGLKISGSGTWEHSFRARVERKPSSVLALGIDDQEEKRQELSEELGLPIFERSASGVSRRAKHFFPSRGPEESVPLLMIDPAGYSAGRLAADLGKVLLTPEEEPVLEALRLIDPTILRLATLTDPIRARSGTPKSGVFVLCEGKRRVPLGNMGDGVWRLLMIALSLVNAAKGVLLIDEIDTGLHHTVLEGMWRVVLKTAQRLDVQVFATTHSEDCWKSLARVLEADEPSLDDEVSLQRLESEKTHSVVFPGNRIRIAAENDIEVR